MPFWVTGITAAVAAYGAYSASENSKRSTNAVNNASNAQQNAANRSIDEQRRQYDQTQANLQPFISSGQSALQAQRDLLGLNTPYMRQTNAGPPPPIGGSARSSYLAADSGPATFERVDPQADAIARIRNGSEYSEGVRVGEEAILQNASATGGLRGGNLQAGLAQFRPQLLNTLINRQIDRLGGLANQGLGAATNNASFGANAAGNISNQYGQIGASQAGNAITQAQIANREQDEYDQILGTMGGYYRRNGFGGMGSRTDDPGLRPGTTDPYNLGDGKP